MLSYLAQSMAVFALALYSPAPVNAQFSMDFPTVSPTYISTIDDGYCRPQDVIGKVFYGYAIGHCFKFEVGAGGKIIGDSSDPFCAVKSGTGTVFSTYGGFTGKTLNWNASPVFSGTMDFFENPTLSEPLLVLNAFQSSTNVFDITLELPACNAVPTPVPTAQPTILEPPFCTADQILGSVFHAPFIGNCFQIEVFPGGNLKGDGNDELCEKMSGRGPQFSVFDTFVPNTNIAYFSPGQAGFDGYMDFMRDPMLQAPQLYNNGMLGPKTFNVTLVLPECPDIVPP